MSSRPSNFLTDLVTHRELLWQFTLRNVELRHKGSHLGLVWSFLNPLLMLGLYVMVFGYIFDGKFGVTANETRVDYALGIFLGLTLFHFISEVLGTSPALIVGNPNFVKKVVFPLEILPAAAVATAFFHMLISLCLAVICLLLFGIPLTPEFLWLPVIIVPVVLLALGMAWFFSALGVFIRDIGQMVQFVSMVLMWASGVFYSAQKHPEAWIYLRFNPLLLAIDLIRDAVLWARPINFNHLGYVYLFSIGVCLIGHIAFKRMKPAFADVL
ncbi:ABC transporter permease [Oleiharenicola lentus]|uniref:ABC transporter permease n=1 Tax=Oleiharenicola lentus TaxID=2508720 RepID=UPI003F662386